MGGKRLDGYAINFGDDILPPPPNNQHYHAHESMNMTLLRRSDDSLKRLCHYHGDNEDVVSTSSIPMKDIMSCNTVGNPLPKLAMFLEQDFFIIIESS